MGRIAVAVVASLAFCLAGADATAAATNDIAAPSRAVGLPEPASKPDGAASEAMGPAGLAIAATRASAAMTTPGRPICSVLAEAANRYKLPVAYFAKLIWQESRFRADAISPAGAQGIAQFMPATAAERTLPDPFIASDAIFASAAFLRELADSFHSLGLAAAAYNAGPGRVSRWLGGTAHLPAETIGYVRAVTGHEPDQWRNTPPPSLAIEPAFSCERLGVEPIPPGTSPAYAPPPTNATPVKPWAVILIGNPQRKQLLADYQLIAGRFPKILGASRPSLVHRRISGLRQPRFLLQIEQPSKGAADELCRALLRAGGSCLVLRNEPTTRELLRQDQTATAAESR